MRRRQVIFCDVCGVETEYPYIYADTKTHASASVCYGCNQNKWGELLKIMKKRGEDNGKGKGRVSK